MTVANADGSKETDHLQRGRRRARLRVFGQQDGALGHPWRDRQAGRAASQQQGSGPFLQRDDGKYAGWGVHLFPLDPATEAWTTWPSPHPFEGIDPVWGAYFRVALPGSESPKYSANPAALDDLPEPPRLHHP